MLRTGIATAALLLTASAACAQGDTAAGEQVFKSKCTMCHMIGEGAKTKVGPELNGVVGRPAASIEGFNYSQGMKDAAAKGLVWTPENLTPFLTKPRDFVHGTKMAFPGLNKPEDVTNLIAYLGTFPAPAQ